MVIGNRTMGRRRGIVAALVLLLLLTAAGCAKYNTFFNAKRAYDRAEFKRTEREKAGEDVTQASSAERGDYNMAIKKAQKVLEEYPGSGMTDDSLFLLGKAYYRLASYRMSIRNLDLLFTNFPVNDYQEEALYLQAMNYLMIGEREQSLTLLGHLDTDYPGSRFQSEALRVSADAAFALEHWQEARGVSERYITDFPDAKPEERDHVALQLGRCLWELEEYEAGVEQMSVLIETAGSPETVFRARLLQARFHSRVGSFEEADELLGRLGPEAEMYKARGSVLLAEAENLVVQERHDDAGSLLMNIPEEWPIKGLKPRIAEMLGDIHLRNWQLEKASEQFKIAERGVVQLEDPDALRTRASILREYLAATDRLGSATEDRIPALKLKQANALLFGLEKPRLALDAYLEILALDVADSNATPRACYGAVTIYRDYLDQADSASVYEERLLAEYPESPQAFRLRSGESADLLAHLLDRRELEQQERRLLAVATEDSVGAPADSLVLAVDDLAGESEAPEYFGDMRWQPRKMPPQRPLGRRT